MLIYTLLDLLFIQSLALKCGEEEIKNCKRCGEDDQVNTCEECEDKYFLFMNNLYCMPCADPYYGQDGCEGNCVPFIKVNSHYIECNENDCIDGYYNLNGFCISCGLGSPGCKTCTVAVNSNDQKEYTCLECISNEYHLNSNGICEHCSPNYCNKCHYESDNEVCDECIEGYYLDSNKQCKICHTNVPIDNGYCNVCSDDQTDYDSGTCRCYSHYVLKDHSTCVKCPNNCDSCVYNSQSQKTECLKCSSGFTLNSEKTCTACEEGCKYCTISEANKFVCQVCYSGDLLSNGKCIVCPQNCATCESESKCTICNYGYALLSDGSCRSCPFGCSSCKANNKDEAICEQCHYNYALKSETECTYCPGLTDEGLENCQLCGYDKENDKYQCYQCGTTRRENSYEYYQAYTFINNTYQCFDNTDKTKPEFYGCFEAYKNGNKYECLKCDSYNTIMVTNLKRCIDPSDYDLGSCYSAENVGTEDEPLYSCTQCPDTNAVISKGNQKLCRARENDLSYCLEGTMDNDGNIKCTKCVNNGQLNTDTNICECSSDSFGKFSEWCYKCNDRFNGNPGCNAEKGCKYYSSNDQLNCNECADGYFEYTDGQCYSCSDEIKGCEECHVSEVGGVKAICDSCPYGYSYNSDLKKCELKNCEYYPEISEGCMICEEKREEFITNKKCHRCKAGFLKTKDEQCVNCRTEENGGPDCLKCAYNLGNIVCDYCPDFGHALNSDRKCYKCQNRIKNCELCKFIKNDDDTEKLTCTFCRAGFYPDSEGKCVSYVNYLKRIDNCYKYFYQINGIYFVTEAYYDDIYDYEYYSYYSTNNPNYINYYDLSDFIRYGNFNYTNVIFPAINSQIETQCINCNSEYYLNSQGICEKVSIEDCTLTSIINNFPLQFKKCKAFCDYPYKYKKIEIEYINSSDEIKLFDPYDFFSKYERYNTTELFENLDDNLKPIFLKSNLCMYRGDNERNYQDCERVRYDENTGSYKCSRCYNNEYFILDTYLNRCKYNYNYHDEYYYYEKDYDLLSDDDFNCVKENIGTGANPIYSCTKCYNDNYLLVTNENNIKYCKYKYEQEIKNCTEAIANTSYIDTIYNCTSCTRNFLPYNSKFFGREICQYVYENVTREKQINLEQFEKVESVNATEEGTCEKKNYFTPDGKKCYQCNNQDVGMPGCKGACTFSLKRNDVIKCEDGCETGYIEIKEGVCQSCDSLNSGCYECHYDDEYPDNYLKVKRERRFVCDFCETGFVKVDGKCKTCEDLDLDYCEECDVDPNNSNAYICTKCNKYSVLEDGECNDCYDGYEFINNNKCFACADYNNGGIKGCNTCEKNDNEELICRICYEGYILLTNNNSCLNVSQNKELENFEYCEQLTMDNNKQLYCSKCSEEYTLLKENDNDKGTCVQITSLYDANLYYNSYSSYITEFFKKYNLKKGDDEYNEFYYYQNYPCQEGVNLGTDDKPIYSCTKCYSRFEYDKSFRDWDEYEYTKIVNSRNNISFCIRQDEDLLENCTEAIDKAKDGVQKYDCLKCIEENTLIYNEEADLHYCQYANIPNKCMVKYCKTCKKGNNYFCDECLLSNYEVSSLTGDCLEKVESPPAILFKDLFNLDMNTTQHERNGQVFNGPSLSLRGMTSSQINSRHAFLIYLTFKIKSSLLRTLDDEQKEVTLPAICEVKQGVESSSDDANLVDYDCHANNTDNVDLSKFKLDGIKQADEENEGQLKPSNLNDIIKDKQMDDFTKKEPSFTLDDLIKYVTFEMNNVQNQTAKDFIFDFKIEGKLNKEIATGIITENFDLNEIDEKASCDFAIEADKKASLSCKIDINKYKALSLLSFKTSEIATENNNIYLAKLDQVYLVNNIEKEEEDNNKTAIIAGCVVAGVVVIGAGVGILIYFLKCRKVTTPNSGNSVKVDVNITNNEKINNGKQINIMEPSSNENALK